MSAEEFKKLKNRVSLLETSNKKLLTSNQNLVKDNEKLKSNNSKLLDLARTLLEENKEIKLEQNTQRTKVNAAHYHCDSVEQYDRKENLNYHEVEEKEGESEQDLIDAVVNRANYALSQSEHYKDTQMNASDIQRIHRIGKKKVADPNSTTPPKPRKIICRFKSYKLRQKVIFTKKNLKKHATFKDSFITENLTPFRSKLLWYIKHHCDGRFVKVHSRDGNIRAQMSDAQGDDDPFVTIQTPDDIHKLGVNIDLKLINDKYLRFEVQPQINFISTYNRYEELMNEIEEDIVDFFHCYALYFTLP